MVKNNKKPRLRFKGFTDEWEQRKLGEIAQITMGQSPDGSTYSDKPLDYILVQGNADLVDGWVYPRIWTSQKTKTCQVGDLIMSVRAPAGSVGKTLYNAVIGRGVAAIKGNEFLFQNLVKMDNDSYWKLLSCGSTFESLNSDNIKNAKIKIPSEIEQTKIGDFFYNLDNLITLHQRKYDKLLNVKKALLDKMFSKNQEKTPKIRFKGFFDAWEQRKLGELGCCQSGIGFPDKEQGGEIGIPFYKVSDMNIYGNEQEMLISNNYVTLEQIQKMKWRPIYDVPSIIFAKVGAAVMLNRKRLCRKPFLIDNNTMAYKLSNKWDINYCKIEFERLDLTKYIQIGALPSYNGKDVENIETIIPKNLNEQTKIGNFFYNLDNLITLHQLKCAKLKNIKKALLDKMFV